eukprot:GEMP01008437.1.p1 GENE.GEMP01008437.1~~GEMP01008437.1.p1  ORF type:complete len:269 (+),score=58.69 GEMP01008437.1:259-1065(+)
MAAWGRHFHESWWRIGFIRESWSRIGFFRESWWRIGLFVNAKSSDWNSDEMTPWKVETEAMLKAKRWKSVPKLKEIRNLPRRRLCLQLLEDGPDAITAGWAIKPAPEDRAPIAGVSKKKPTKVLLSEDSDSEGATIAWTMNKYWVAQKMEKEDGEWVVVETVNLKNGDTAGRGVEPAEWSSRFNRREKQIQVGKNTEGYRGLLKWREDHGVNQGEPQTPRVAELSSKRQFDGRLSHWRILLHAFSQKDSDAGSGTSSGDTDELKIYRI